MEVAIRHGRRDPSRIVAAKTEKNRFKDLRRPLDLLADLIRDGAHDRYSAAKRVQTTEENAHRILGLLKEIVPGIVEVEDAKPRRLRFDVSKVSSPPSHPVAVAACFGASLASLFEGTSYESGMREAVAYVIRRARRGKQFRHIERKFIFVRQGGEPSLRTRTGEFDDLLEALIYHHPLTFKYKGATTAHVQRTVHPLSIAVYDHQLYVIARDERGQIKPYRFSRSEDLDLDRTSTFDYPTLGEYDPQEFFSRFFGITVGDKSKVEHIVVRLSGPWAAFARTHRWHRTQEVREEGERVRVELDVPICQEVESWILGFGEHVEVVEPARLRDQIKKRIITAARQLEAEREA